MRISPENQKHLSAAEGYIALGMFQDAEAELAAVGAEVCQLPEFLAVKLAYFMGKGEWPGALGFAKALVDMDPENSQWPISLAYVTRRAECIQAAKAILLDAISKFPKEPIIPYNLTCYDCQLGDIPSAKKFFEVALRMEPKIWRMALEDDDLKPLWDEIDSLEDWLSSLVDGSKPPVETPDEV